MPAGVTTTSIGDGVEEVKVLNLQTYAPLTTSIGFVRIRMELDTNLDETLEATSHTQVFGWQDTPTYAQCETCSVPFLLKPIFTGTVDSLIAPGSLEVAVSVGVTGVDLTDVLKTDGTQYYVEVISGDNEGQRWDVDEATSDADTLEIDFTSMYNTSESIPTNIAADQIVLRKHWTPGEVTPVDDFADRDGTSDKLLIYDPSGVHQAVGGYQILSPLELTVGPTTYKQWRSMDSSDTTDYSNRVIGPSEGFYVHRENTGGTLKHVGLVRENDYCSPLVQGPNLFPNPYPVDASAADWGVTVANGFTGSNNPSQADQIMLWMGDGVAGSQEFGGNFLLDWTLGATTYQWWAPIANSTLTNENATKVFKRNRPNHFTDRKAIDQHQDNNCRNRHAENPDAKYDLCDGWSR